MKIFITGATGFVGSNLVSYFSNHIVSCFDRNTNNLQHQLDQFQPEWIINCAAEIYNKDIMWSANVELAKVCLDWIKHNPKSKLIHLGSSSEYGAVDHPTSEQDPILAVDMYGITKGIATQLCKTYALTYGVDVIVIRPYSLYGPGERSHRLFPKLWQAFKYNRSMELVQGVHDFVYIDDFSRAVEIFMNSEKRIPGDVINIGSGIQTSNAEVLRHFRNITGIDGPVKEIEKFCTPKVWQANIEHAKTHYNWNPTTPIVEGIEKFINKAFYE